jgi:hypothetical protein
LETSANDAFDTYRELYYEGGVSSVYLWDLDEGFAGVVLIKKSIMSKQSVKVVLGTRFTSWKCPNEANQLITR